MLKRWGFVLFLALAPLALYPVLAPASFSTTAPRNDYVGNGATATYTYSFRIFSSSDLKVTKTDTSGVSTTLTLTTDYTVTGVNSASGGTITLTAGNLTSGYALTIRFQRSIQQATDLRNQGGYFASTHENKFDETTRYAQQLQDQADRSLKLPETEVGTATKTTLPTATSRASKFLGFDSSGNPIAAAGTSADLTPVSAYINTLLDDATATAARTTLGAISSAEAIAPTIIDAKGDLIVGTAADTAGRLAVGTNGQFVTADSAQTTGLKYAAPTMTDDLRCTLTTALAVTTADVTAATTVYVTPYTGNLIALYDGTNWLLRSTAEMSIAVPATTSTMYDLFVYDNAGTPTLEALAWTNDTTRATALALQNGVYVKTGATTRRYQCSFRTTGSSGQTEDSLAKRYLWNYYHRVTRPMKVIEATNTWTYTTATFRQANAAAGNQLDFIIGVAEEMVSARVAAWVSNDTTSIAVTAGIGLDSTSANSALLFGGAVPLANGLVQLNASYAAQVAAGRHVLVWLEWSTATGTTTWYGDNGAAALQSGILGEIRH